MKRLVVYLNNNPVGELAQNAGGLMQFTYSPEWLARKDSMPLSRSLPLENVTFKGKRARSFFAGILPEEGPRRRIAEVLGISNQNDFAMLERIGGECAGAVCLLPEGMPPPALNEKLLRELNAVELGKIISELPRRPLLAGESGLRLSLAGAQDKIAVTVQGGTIALPLGNTPSTHIIKPEPDRFPGLAVTEWLCMKLARATGLNVPDTSLLQVGDKPCILVQRYDRSVTADGFVRRTHQEDFCQALGYPPEHKYQQEGGPLVRDCIALLRDWSSVPALDIPAFLDGLIFNMLIGNADAHGKNYSLLYQDGERRLAPFYDLVCTLSWPELSKTPAMKIGRSESIETITAVHWKKMSEESKIGWPMVRDHIRQISQAVADNIRPIEEQCASQNPSKTLEVADIIHSRAESIQQGLSQA
ncbi:MAG: type II toxin-antitoxin system HipA family toxin [bacterium]